jgi:hypothetical protein
MTGTHRRKRRSTSTDDYAAMLHRILRAYGRRIGEDPAAGLAHLRDLELAFADAVNAGIAAANRDGVSINRMAEILGVSKQAIHKRVQLGQADGAGPVSGGELRTVRRRELGGPS